MFVADPGLGNILNFNVGENVDLMVPSVSAYCDFELSSESAVVRHACACL